MIISFNKGGLSNRIKSIVSCFRYAQENNIEVKIFWPVLNSYDEEIQHLLNCEFGKLFQNSIEIKELPKNKHKIYSYPYLMVFDRDNIPPNFDTYNHHTKNKKWTSTDLEQRNIDHNYNKIPKNVIENYLSYFKVLKPIEELQDKIDNFSKKFNNNTISVHIRSWSRKNEARRVINRRNQLWWLYVRNGIQKFENEMKKYTGHNFFLTTDSHKVKTYFQNRSVLKDKIICYSRKTDLDTSRDFPEGVQEDLIELYLLSKNKIIIGSHNSTFTEVAWWLAQCPKNITIISLD